MHVTYQMPDAMPICVPTSAMTLAGFRQWVTSDDFPEKLRVSFIQDTLWIDMSPEEFEKHNKVKTELTRVLANLCREENSGTLFSDRALITNEAANVSTEPDLMFVAWDTFRSSRVTLVPRADHPDESKELQGTPDVVVEIVSRWTVPKDTRHLRQAYFQAGIPEYWLIDALGDEIDFQILTRGDTDYRSSLSDKGLPYSKIFGRTFRLRRDRDPVGLWQYTLESLSPTS